MARGGARQGAGRKAGLPNKLKAITIGYERPRLSQVAMTTRSLDDLTDEEIFELRDAIRALQAGAGRPALEPPSAGRKAGLPNKLKAEQKREMAEAVAKAVGELPEPFAGDSYALLTTVYKDTRLPMSMRVDAAKITIGYERPRLSQVAMTTRSLDDLTDEEIFELRDAIRALQAGAGPTGA